MLAVFFSRILKAISELTNKHRKLDSGSQKNYISKKLYLQKDLFFSFHTVKNGVFQNSCLGCLYVHSSTTPNRVFLKPPFEGVTEHPQNTITSGSESFKGVLCKYLHSINS